MRKRERRALWFYIETSCYPSPNVSDCVDYHNIVMCPGLLPASTTVRDLNCDTD